ncbi:TRAP-type mannitol/chloroaromatic compound transport system, periplasmic component [Kingella potus]|uniref:TRAP-type mannitol/chloroaromatic compound transport system, periplasmic component n=1 Tax=Kingella potus TaxID=265175 RepID=A0A377QZ93_9NEIS|nr:TRAP transporter substrate-binding protein DctP [Kingella potus]STR00312.1 TRAP-type mannitol/chloroaromatic compound transport system, periplasmic component [Kingella potus]
MNIRKPTLLMLAAAAAALLLSGTAAAAGTILRYSDHEPYGNMRTRFINDVFFKNVEAESQGRLKIEAHWGGSIAKAHNELQAVADGKTDLITAVPEYSLQQLPLHQLFKGFMIGPVGGQQVQTLRRIYADIPELTAEYQKNGVTPLIIATGYPVAFFSTKPLKNLNDIKGQTWRSASFWHRDFLKNAGAMPTTSRWGEETYAKLASGEMHGLMVNIDSAIDIKAYEHAPYALVSRDFWLGHIYPVVISSQKWAQLSEADRAAFRRAAEKSYGELGRIMDESYAQILQTARDKGVNLRELSPEEVREWAKTSNYRAVLDSWAAEQERAGTAGTTAVLQKLKKHLLPQ